MRKVKANGSYTQTAEKNTETGAGRDASPRISQWTAFATRRASTRRSIGRHVSRAFALGRQRLGADVKFRWRLWPPPTRAAESQPNRSGSRSGSRVCGRGFERSAADTCNPAVRQSAACGSNPDTLQTPAESLCTTSPLVCSSFSRKSFRTSVSCWPPSGLARAVPCAESTWSSSRGIPDRLDATVRCPGGRWSRRSAQYPSGSCPPDSQCVVSVNLCTSCWDQNRSSRFDSGSCQCLEKKGKLDVDTRRMEATDLFSTAANRHEKRIQGKKTYLH